MMSEETTLRQMRSEIATLQFLKRHTKVPVPAVIGYSKTPGTDPPPFMILENVDRIRMTLLLSTDVDPRIMDRVHRDLVAIQPELLRHPSANIGMLDISPESSITASTPPTATLAPISLELEQDSLKPPTDGTYTCANHYYAYKCNIW